MRASYVNYSLSVSLHVGTRPHLGTQSPPGEQLAWGDHLYLFHSAINPVRLQ